MQKWEYLSLLARLVNEDWRPKYQNGTQLPDWENGPKVYDYLNQLGDAGWELVSETFDSDNHVMRLRFKRPRA